MTDLQVLAQQLDVYSRDGENAAHDVALLARQLGRTSRQLAQIEEASDDERARVQALIDQVADALAKLYDVNTSLVAAAFDIRMVMAI